MRMKKQMELIGFSLLCCATLILSAPAQSIFGTMLGTVKDNSGAVIPGASVKITNVDENTSRTVQTNDNGDYEEARSLQD